MVINTNGELVLTYTNGTTVNLGRVVGNDGQDGKDGQDGQAPYIGENGNWWIGTTDTGVKATADDAVPAASDAVVKPGSDNTVAVDYCRRSLAVKQFDSVYHTEKEEQSYLTQIFMKTL